MSYGRVLLEQLVGVALIKWAKLLAHWIGGAKVIQNYWSCTDILVVLTIKVTCLCISSVSNPLFSFSSECFP
jgi:hypothetical protein